MKFAKKVVYSPVNTTSGLKKWESTYRPRQIRLAEMQAAARERNSFHYVSRRKTKRSMVEKKENRARVYLLRDPFTQEILYIGQTTSALQTRKVCHISVSHYSKRWKAGYNKELYTWLQTLLMVGAEPIIELIAEHHKEKIHWWEAKYIRQYAKRGHKLFNRKGLEKWRRKQQKAC